MDEGMKSKIRIWARKNFVGIALLSIVLFAAAGRLNWTMAWVYTGVNFLLMLSNLIVLTRKNPEVLASRADVTQDDSKDWDKIFTTLYGPTLLVMMAVIGLDAGRYLWSSVSPIAVNISLAIFVIGWGISLWAMVANKFFETSVRIQEDRSQETISSGPYALVRHPGYAGLILYYVATPILLGSWWGTIPALILSLGFVLRTMREDQTLLEELPSYQNYANKVRFRLIPWIW